MRPLIQRSTLALRESESDGPIRMFALGAGPVAFVPPQPAGWAFLVWTRSAAVTIRSDDLESVATPEVGVWIPAGTRFGIDSRARCDLRIAYVRATLAPKLPACAVRPSALVLEIFERAVVIGYLDPKDERDARLIAVALDEVRRLEPAEHAWALAIPRDPALRSAVEVALRRADEPPLVGELAAIAGMTVRTFERRFTRETGLTPRAWLRRARLHCGLRALAEGASITEAGLASGYASLSAFISAYRRNYGTTPGATSAQGRRLKARAGSQSDRSRS